MANLLASVTSTSSDTSSGSWTQITDLTSGSVTVVGTASVVLLVFHITPDDTGTDETAQYRFTVDASATGSPVNTAFADSTNETNGLTMVWAVDGLSAGSHTFTVEWITETGTPATATDRTRSFQVIEFDEDATLKVDVASTSSQADPASWATMTDMTGTFTTASGAGHLVLCCVPMNEASDSQSNLQFAIDSSREGPVSAIWTDATNEYNGVSMAYFKTGLSAASHTFELQWQAGQGSGNTNTSLTRTFQVIEFTQNFSLATNVSSTSAENDPATWGDMTDMTGTLTPDSASSVLMIIACGVLGDAGSDSTSEMRLADDSVREGPQMWSFSDEANGIPGFLMAWCKTGETASSTWTLQWQAVTGSGLTETEFTRTFQIIDFSVVTSTLEQEGFRWRNDDGSESAATWRQSQDVNDTVARNTNIRIRTTINETTSGGDADAETYQLEYKETGDAATEYRKVELT